MNKINYREEKDNQVLLFPTLLYQTINKGEGEASAFDCPDEARVRYQLQAKNPRCIDPSSTTIVSFTTRVISLKELSL